jgi:hypothetical protein
MPVFNDSSNIPPLLPDGDYVFTVKAFEIAISQGAKTRGSEKYELDLAIEPTGKPVFENLIDHPSTNWKIDCFLKSAGVTIAKGERYEFRQDVAKDSGCRWVNPIGLRGWCRLSQEQLPPRDNKPGEKPMTINKVAMFYTDKPKLAPVRVEQPEEEDKPF